MKQKSILKLLVLSICFYSFLTAHLSTARADEWDEYEESVSDPSSNSDNPSDPDNEYPPGEPVPPGNTTPNQPGSDLLRPPGLTVTTGPGVYLSSDGQGGVGVDGGAGIGVAAILEGGVGRSSLILIRASAIGRPGQFGYGTVDARFRYRVPVDKEGVLWAGFGGDINYRGTKDNKNVNDYLKINLPVGLIGTLQTFKIGKSTKCVIKAFLRGSIAVFDNEVQVSSAQKWDVTWNNFFKPTVGIESSFQCDSFEIKTEYDHSFTFAPLAKKSGNEKTATVGTDIINLELSKTWSLKKVSDNFRLGFFVNGRMAIEHGDTSLPMSNPVYDTKYSGQTFTGLQINF